MNVDIASVSVSELFKVLPVSAVVPTAPVQNNQASLSTVLHKLESSLGGSLDGLKNQMLEIADRQGPKNGQLLMLQMKVSEHAYSMSIASGVASSARQSLQSLLQNG